MKNQFSATKFGVISCAVLFTLASAIPAFSKPVTYVVDDAKGRDSISFTSDAPIELIVGKTNKVKGSITVDDSLDLSKPFNATFDVDLASIDTGIPLRNEHMRDNFLETAKYPKATFAVTMPTGVTAKLIDKQKVSIKAQGNFTLHGVTVKKDIPVDITYIKNCPTTQDKFANCDLIQIKSTFKVPFVQHNIKRPEVVFQKLADTVIITVGATARREVKK